MLVQFFRDSGARTCLGAWLGLVVVVGYSAFAAWTSARLNSWYNEFYDLLQHQFVEAGSGAFEEGEDLGALRAEVWAQIASFGGIVLPLVFASPASRWVRSAWALAWRVALMRSYLDAWDVSSDPIEGSAQRLHEDTQRFCVALQGCLGLLLDAMFTLIVFVPILLDLSTTIPPPLDVTFLRDYWLLVVAYLAAGVGLTGAMIAGKRLVELEVNNQKVEAGLRRDLVILETSPDSLFGESSGHSSRDGSPRSTASAQTAPSARRTLRGGACTSPLLFFSLTLKELAQNYHALFRNFFVLNVWLTAFDQVMILFPYLVAAPLLFADDPAQRITLGTLVKLSNSFAKVFGSLNVVSDNWAAVNEWRSVVRRLREFEGQLFAKPPAPRSGAPARPPPGPALVGREASLGARRRVSHDHFADSRLHVEAVEAIENGDADARELELAAHGVVYPGHFRA